MIEEDQMRHVNATVGSKVVRRFAAVACVAILGVGAAACGDDSVDTPGAPTPGIDTGRRHNTSGHASTAIRRFRLLTAEAAATGHWLPSRAALQLICDHDS